MLGRLRGRSTPWLVGMGSLPLLRSLVRMGGGTGHSGAGSKGGGAFDLRRALDPVGSLAAMILALLW